MLHFFNICNSLYFFQTIIFLRKTWESLQLTKFIICTNAMSSLRIYCRNTYQTYKRNLGSDFNTYASEVKNLLSSFILFPSNLTSDVSTTSIISTSKQILNPTIFQNFRKCKPKLSFGLSHHYLCTGTSFSAVPIPSLPSPFFY